LKGDLYDKHVDFIHFTPREPPTPPPEILALFGALRYDPVARNRFFGTLGGTVPIPEYYAPENLQRIVSKAP
jgi:hypothetical protein